MLPEWLLVHRFDCSEGRPGKSERGFAAPAPRPAGPITFRVTTTAPGQTTVGLIRLHEGVPLERVLGHIRRVFSEDPNVVVEAGRAIMRDADQFGTAATEPGVTVTFTVALPPGRYYLVDYHRIYDNAPGDWVRPFDVLPCAAASQEGQETATVVLDEPRMYAPSRMAVGAPFRVINAGGQPNEAVLMRCDPARRGPSCRRSSPRWTTALSRRRFRSSADRSAWGRSRQAAVPW